SQAARHLVPGRQRRCRPRELLLLPRRGRPLQAARGAALADARVPARPVRLHAPLLSRADAAPAPSGGAGARQLPGSAGPHACGETRQLWLSTAYLPSFTADIASRLSGIERAEALLQGLTRSRYFTDSHSGDGAVHYRYHALFRELLLQHAEQAFTPAQRQELMQRSAQLLEQDVELEAALALYQDAGDWPSAAQLILTQAGTLFGQGRWQTLQGWLRRMPGEAIEASPWLEFWIGACRAQTDPPAGRAIVEAVHRRFVDADDLVGQALSACAVIESYSVDWGDFTRINPWIAILQGILATEPRFPALAIELRVWSGLLMAMAQCQPQHALGPEAADRVWQLCR